jgi:hypothetical protein
MAVSDCTTRDGSVVCMMADAWEDQWETSSGTGRAISVDEEPPQSAPPVVALSGSDEALAQFLPKNSEPEQAPHRAPVAVPVARYGRVSGKAMTAIGLATAAAVVWVVVWSRAPVKESRAQARNAIQTPRTENAEPAAIPASSSAGPSRQAPIPQSAATSLYSEDRPRPERDEDGELIVSTEPAGGRVTVNGIGWGITPLTIRYLPLGAKRIRVTKDGYAVEERVVRLEPNRSTIRLRIPLRSRP